MQEWVGVEAVGVHHEHDVVAGFGGAAAQEGVLPDATDDGDVYGVVVAVGMHVSADDGDVELPDALLHPAYDLPAHVLLDYRHDVHHAQGPSAHGRDVIHVDQDREVTGVEGVSVHEGLHDPVSGEQDVLVADVYGRRILALGSRDLREPVGGEEIDDPVYGVLAGDARVAADRIGHLFDRFGIQRQSPLFLRW